MFVDASAIVAILNQEPEADTFSDTIEESGEAITSPIAVFEATLAVCVSVTPRSKRPPPTSTNS